jgi:hypothetical protein
MAFTHSPKIVQDGLIFYVDAANPRSYVSGSTTCNNLVSSNTGSLLNDVTFDSGSQGSWYFDGTDDIINFGDHDSINDVVLGANPVFSWELWVNPNDSVNSTCCGVGTTSGTGHIVFYNYPSGNTLNFNKVNGDSPSATRTYQVQTTFPHGGWTHYIFCYDGSGGTPTVTTYINGEAGSNTLAVNDSTSKIGADGDNLLMIGERMATGATDYNGEISIMKIYNRILSSKESLQNYNALKNRFK